MGGVLINIASMFVKIKLGLNSNLVLPKTILNSCECKALRPLQPSTTLCACVVNKLVWWLGNVKPTMSGVVKT